MTSTNDGPANTEHTPLLEAQQDREAEQVAHDALYDRFASAKKRTIVAICVVAGVVPFLVSGSFIPAIPQIVEDLNSTPAAVGQAVSISIFGNAIGNLWWAVYCGFYGRRPIYLFSLPTLCIASVGVALSRSIPTLLFWRILQAFGCSSGMSVGASVIGDIYRLEHRGTAMGIFFGAVLLGPAIAPFLGGLAAQYASWRLLQGIFAILGACAFVLVYALLPETAHPGTRGLDRMIKAERAASGISDEEAGPSPFRWVWLNPLSSLKLLRAPNILLVCLGGSATLLTDFTMLFPLAYTLAKRYHIENVALVGLLFLPVGVGNVIGAPLAGRFSDWMVVSYRAKRKGIWVPEDRLRATFIGAGILAPMSVLLSGLITTYIPGTLGIVLNMLVFFLNGVGVDMALSPSAAYFVDVLHTRSAEVISATNALRSIIIALGCSAVLPSVQTFGHVATNTAAAILAWIGFIMIFASVKYGDRMRAWTTVEWSTPKNN